MTLPPGHIFAGLPARAAGNHEAFLDGRIALHCGDCIDVMATLPENSVDSVVCDPPYHLTSIVKRFGSATAAPPKEYAEYAHKGANPYKRASTGFMGKQWDGGDIAFQPETWAAMYRVLKPGAHLLAFGGTRNYDQLVYAIRQAGFEIRDCIVYAFGSGFPKSHDVSKGIDRAVGAEREVVGHQKLTGNSRVLSGNKASHDGDWNQGARCIDSVPLTIPATDAARQWSGWGTALKPAVELVCLARKPLSEGTVAANVLNWGTGALNVDGCRVEGGERDARDATAKTTPSQFGAMGGSKAVGKTSEGRWPANLIHDGSDEVVAAFPETTSSSRSGEYDNGTFSSGKVSKELIGDSGSAARFFASFNGRDGEASADRRYTEEGATNFAALPGTRREGVEASRLFYTSKADGDDRLGSCHPTVKPIDLMQYLVRLVTPKGGVVLDPFAGTGTTGEAAFHEGMRAVLIEREAEYQADIRRRMALVLAGPDERARESIKACGMVASPGPLFETLRREHTAEAAEALHHGQGIRGLG